MSEAIGVFYTFTTYGTHLAGSVNGSVSRGHRNWGAPTLTPNIAWHEQAKSLMSESKFVLDASGQNTVLAAIKDACIDRSWHLYCAHIRTNHAHAVIQASAPADRVLAYLKARATFRLKPDHPRRQRFWTKHGSTLYLWDRQSLDAAVDYVMNQQGLPMACWIAG